MLLHVRTTQHAFPVVSRCIWGAPVQCMACVIAMPMAERVFRVTVQLPLWALGTAALA